MTIDRRSALLSFFMAPFYRTVHIAEGRLPQQGSAPGPEGINVRKYGAVGDGSRDDSPAFKTAFAAVASAGSGAWLYIPPGRYRVASLALAGQPVRMVGDGETSVLVGPGTGPALTLTDCPVVRLADVGLAAALSGTGGDYALLQLISSPDVALHRLRVEGSGGDGVDIRACDGIDIVGCTFTKASRYGLRVTDNANLSRPRRIRDCVAADNGQHGVLLQRIVGFDIEANVVLRNRSMGIHATDGSDWLQVTRNRCSANGTSPLEHGIYVLHCKGVVAEANTCFANAGDGILLRECNDSLVANNVCVDNHRHGLSVQGIEGGPSDAFAVTGNVTLRNTQHGMVATGISRAIYTGNLGADNTRYGLASYAGPTRAATDVVFVGNAALENHEGELLVAGASSAALVGNVGKVPSDSTVPAVALKDFGGHRIGMARAVSNVELVAAGNGLADLRGIGNMIQHLQSDEPLR